MSASASDNVERDFINQQSLHQRLLLICAVVLGIFALYAPSLRLMLYHDDAANITWMNAFNVVTIFSMPGQTGASARPAANVLWILTREAFGWYIPALIHAWSVWLHVLNTALVAALAMRLGSSLGVRGLLFPILSALIFGLFPFSYQAVLWAGAFYHPVLAAYGLAAVHAYLTARERHQPVWWLLCAGLLVLACLSHESGFMFGPLILAMEMLLFAALKRPLHRPAVAIGALSLIYPILNRILFPNMWGVSQGQDMATMLSRVGGNLPYMLQGMVSWMIIWLRAWIGLTQSNPLIVTLLFMVSVIPALIWLISRRALYLGLLALVWWLALSMPSLLLQESYLPMSPRLLYAPAVGIALFWGCVTALLLRRLRWRIAQAALLAPVIGMLVWCVPYISDRMNETARLTPAMTMIDSDLRASPPSAKVLYINLPYYSAPAYPSFLIGVEGIPIFQSDNIPAWTWLATVSGVRRDTTYVRHDISLTRGSSFFYGVPGPVVNDVALRSKIMASNYIYRFDYDAPGLRARRLAIIGTDQTKAVPLAKFAYGTMQVALRQASAALCDNHVVMQLAWSDSRNMNLATGVFVHVMDEQDRQAIVADRDLLDGYLPLNQIPVGMVITETRKIDIPSTVAPLKEVQLGAYLRDNGARLTAVRVDGGRWEGDSVIVPVESDNAELCRRIGE